MLTLSPVDKSILLSQLINIILINYCYTAIHLT